MIESMSNSRIKQVRQWVEKARERKRDMVYVVEGVRMFVEAPVDQIREVYISRTLHEKAVVNGQDKALVDKLRQVAYEIVSDEVYRKMSDTQSPQGIMCVLERRDVSLSKMLDAGSDNALYVLLENLQDPGNLGTIIRTSEGAGVAGVIMSQDTVDIYNPKTIRSTMGSIYRVPHIYVEDIQETIRELKARGITTYAAHLAGKVFYDEVSYQGASAFLIGNEGNGLKKETADLADTYVRIPMQGQLESLNAAVATSLLIYEVNRQKRAKSPKS